MTGPIRPDEVPDRHKIPAEVFEVVNELLKEHAGKKRIEIEQEWIVRGLEKKGFKRQDIFREKWLDIEPYYNDVGWDVVHRKPMIFDTRNPHFVFRRW